MRNLSKKYGKQLLDTVTNTELDALKTASKKVAHKAAAATGQFMGKKLLTKLWNQNLYLLEIHEILNE